MPRWPMHFKGMTSADIREGFLNSLRYTIGKDQYTLTKYDQFMALSNTVRERLIERWIMTQQEYYHRDAKRLYYLSMEFLMGRLLTDSIMNLGISDACAQAMDDLGLDLEEIASQEFDAGLGNGGLGRLAACFLDSMATLQLPAMGYGIRYEFGIFNQKIVGGRQQEVPEQWLQYGNPWEIERPENRVRVRFYGRTLYETDEEGRTVVRWIDSDDVIAIPFDTPVPGFDNNTVNTLRLWLARSPHEFDLEDFNSGDYIGACQDKLESENISKVLYPNDSNHSGRELRLKQQHFFTSASLQDIIRRYLKAHDDFREFHRKNAVQLNDTHPAVAIVELMRLLLDEHRLGWNEAWKVVTNTFAYTNHTLMPEALETWPVSLIQRLLPRHMEIIYEINRRFLKRVGAKYPGDAERRQRMSIIEEGAEPKVRMAWLAIVGSHSVNGVAALHTKLLTEGLMRDFHELWPRKFNNKTNGITPRRWLYKANPGLSRLITSRLGTRWITNLEDIRSLAEYADSEELRHHFLDVKRNNKVRLAEKLHAMDGLEIDPDTMIDVQVKRIHEYKRQLLNALHCLHLYNEIKAGRAESVEPRTVLFGGKAAPGYYMAKLIIRFINSVGDLINNDPDAKARLKVIFVPNYRVTLAELMIPAADLSEQISTAGTEASGTGNMKFALNGALTIGTMDGANIEIREEVGNENIFIFGLTADQVREVKSDGYNPYYYYEKSPRLKAVMDMVLNDRLCPEEPGLYKPIIDSVLYGEDRYMIMADFDSYIDAQEKVARIYRDKDSWARKAIRNVAGMGKFSSDRTIQQYAQEIWRTESVKVNRD
ncbi:MAG: glycogen/starch/alpha-glucan family phosphorylase [Chitinivibrionales bacterium]|nr:glycogen/starch/alpha-glucan family phosphorylase [Chitinivibrionales bacterium]MBD3356072.1 glycogen/starch/alpha-glucan family phosphorylase [Chitinivibrionales bacterium]